MKIAETKEKGREMVNELERSRFCVYSDGSGYEGGIGAAAQATTATRGQVTRHHYLGATDRHTVFERELVGAILALDIIRSQPRLTKACILIDSQAAIKAIDQPNTASGRYLDQAFHSQLLSLAKSRWQLQVTVAWVPGHQGIQGNEDVDAEAKQAAEGRSTPTFKPIKILHHPLPASKAAVVAAKREQFNRLWRQQWQKSPKCRFVKKIDNAHPPSKAIHKIFEDLSRAECSVLAQLRTAHIGLNHHLHRMGTTTTADCPHCAVPETVSHYLLSCRRFAAQRSILLTQSCRRNPQLRDLLSFRSKSHKAVLNYVRATNRFPALLPNDAQPDEVPESQDPRTPTN